MHFSWRAGREGDYMADMDLPPSGSESGASDAEADEERAGRCDYHTCPCACIPQRLQARDKMKVLLRKVL